MAQFDIIVRCPILDLWVWPCRRSGLRWSSVLVFDVRSDAGAAHSDEAGLQPVVVAVPSLHRPDPAQQQHLVHDGSGLQAQVLAALRVQTATQQTASLRQHRWEQRVVTRDAEEGEREGAKINKYHFNSTIKGPYHCFLSFCSWNDVVPYVCVSECVSLLVCPWGGGVVLQRPDVCGDDQSAGVKLQRDRFYRRFIRGLSVWLCWVFRLAAWFRHGCYLCHHHHHHHGDHADSLRKRRIN